MEKKEEIIEKFFQFLAVIFTRDDMNELEMKEALYYIQYIRSVVSRCLDAQDISQIPILELTVWGTAQGKTNVSIDPSRNPEILASWQLSQLVKRLQAAIDKWDTDDLGQKQGKVIDLMSRLGWTMDRK